MKRVLMACFALLLIGVTAAGCKTKEPESFEVRVVCESEGVYQIFYTCYLGDERYSIGGMANFDNTVLTEKSNLNLEFTKAYLDDRTDVSSFSMDFSPYGKDDTQEAGTTNVVRFDAKYGEEYTVVISGDRESGFVATLVEPE